MLPLEQDPNDGQKHRLEDWLVELKAICRKYRLLLDTDAAAGVVEGETAVVDLDSGHVIAIGLTYLTDTVNGVEKITAYDCTGSILDGVWLIEREGTSVEQRSLGRTFPQPEHDLPT